MRTKRQEKDHQKYINSIIMLARLFQTHTGTWFIEHPVSNRRITGHYKMEPGQ